MGFLPGYFGFTTDPKAFAKEVRRLGCKDQVDMISGGAAATHHTFHKANGDFTSIVTLDLRKTKGRTRAQIAAVLAHEAVHVWQTNEEWMRETKPGREIEAYAIQYFTQCMLSELERKRK